MKAMKPFFLLLIVLLLLTSCGGASDLTPQSIDEEVDVCEACSMMVQDNQFSAQIVSSSGEVYKFDDVGCMAMYINDNQSEGQPYVRDFNTKEWLKVENALLILAEDVETPMNYGFVSFANRDDLNHFLTEFKGKELTWEHVLENMKERSSGDENQHSHN